MKVNPLDRRVQFRALKGGGPTCRNATVSVSIPLDMLDLLKWTRDKPIRVEFQSEPSQRPSLRLQQVNPEEYDLVREGLYWVPRRESKRKRG